MDEASKEQGGDSVVPSIQTDSDNVWFSELSSLWPGQCLSLRVAKTLTRRKSAFQDIVVFDSDSPFGRVLVLDGVIQLTEYDECGYQEPLAHLPLCSALHEPRKVLVVGGGDGGVLREICRHTSVEQVDLCEIDEEVIKVSKEFFPSLSCGFSDPRVKVHIGDGAEFARNTPESTYDCIIVDSSDPIGPASVLFEKPFLSDIARIVKPGGVVATQAESLWLHMDIIKGVLSVGQECFKGGCVGYAYTTVPTYPSGQIGFMLCSKAAEGTPNDLSKPKRTVPESAPDRQQEGSSSPLPPLRYYSEALHPTMFVLPRFASQALASLLRVSNES